MSGNTEPDAVFDGHEPQQRHRHADGQEHVCGAGTFPLLPRPGLTAAEAALKLVYEQPAEWLDFYAQEYGIDSPGEQPRRGSWAVDEE